jgi:prepilin-type processing-associated H-X9-DG protein
MFERDLAAALRKNHYHVYTQRQIETLLDNDVQFDFGGRDYKQFKKDQKNIYSDVYASDLFLFWMENNVLVLIDSLSLKTSINDNDGSKVFIANDAEGVVYDNLIKDNSDLKLGQVMIVSMNTHTGDFNVAYFDGSVTDLVGLFHNTKTSKEKISFNLNESIFGGRSREVLTVINRNAVTGKKQTSFNRGVQVRRDFIPQLISVDVFKSVASGVVSVDTSDLSKELLTLG